MAHQPMSPPPMFFVPFEHQYHSDATPNKLLKRILNAGFEINCGDVNYNEAGPRFLNIEAKIGVMDSSVLKSK